jgi:hypothetical protein
MTISGARLAHSPVVRYWMSSAVPMAILAVSSDSVVVGS